MSHAGPTTLPEIAAALGDHARQAGRRIALSWGQHGMLTIEGGVSPDGTADSTVRDLLQRAQVCGTHAAVADESGAALLYTPRHGLVGHAARPDAPRPPARITPALQGIAIDLPEGGAIVLLPDALSAHRRLALQQGLSDAFGARLHRAETWAWDARAGIVLPAAGRAALLSFGVPDEAQIRTAGFRPRSEGGVSLSLLPLR